LLPDQLPGSIGAAIIDQQAAKLDVRMRYENPIDGIDKSIEGFLFIEQRSENLNYGRRHCDRLLPSELSK
jgi:hypothetical protein